MGIKEIQSKLLPKLSKEVKSSINLGSFYLYELTGDYPYAIVVDQKAYLLDKKGRAVKIVPNINLPTEDMLYFADLPRPKSLFDFKAI
jgi:hypothetical protein